MTHAGKIQTEVTRLYIVRCKTCNDDAAFCTDSKAEAAKEFRLHGWKQIAGQWTCPGCVWQKEKVNG